QGVAAIRAVGMPVFLDMKYHDIPNTVAGAIRAAGPIQPKIINVHAQGGPEMLRQAAQAGRVDHHSTGPGKGGVA
ncbi:MAG: orotidine 5'-phosphate decarboxylase, partial [Thiotrichales bacterium]|nr:orotidine 5'-phosphate decarboxylase [Thiotrichales bacterium]